MLWRYVKSQLWVLLCGGLVGPIFLVVYFALGPTERPYIGWMFYISGGCSTSGCSSRPPMF